MSALRTLLVDDEAPARKRLHKLLQPFVEEERIEMVGEAADGVEALRILEVEEVDLLFLDVQMPELSGFDVLDRLPPGNRPAVVFVTAFDEYAVEAFQANAADYLLKPIEEGRIAESIARIEKRFSDGDARTSTEDRLAELLEYLDRQSMGESVPSAKQDYIQQISIPGKDRMIIVPVSDLLSAEVQDGITRLYTLVQNPAHPPKVSRHIVSYTLEALTHRLDPEAFMRVHRSAIVQVQYIREMISWFSGRYKLVLQGGHEVIASRARSKELRARLSL